MATAPAWLPGVTRVSSTHDGGTLLDGPRRMTWHTFEAPYALTAVQGAASLIRAGNEAHFVLHPWGGLVQLLPATRAARTLANPAGGVQTNRLGRVHLQVEVIGWAARPFTASLTTAGRRDLARLVAYARSLGIPDVWPAGPPPAYPGGVSARGQRTWLMKAGHFAHSQVPENDHGDPGAIDIQALLAKPPVVPPPKPPVVPPATPPKEKKMDRTTILHCTESGAAYEAITTAAGLRAMHIPAFGEIAQERSLQAREIRYATLAELVAEYPLSTAVVAG